MDLELVSALAAGIKAILTSAGSESGKQTVQRLFERLRRSPEAQQPDVERALNNITGGSPSDEEFRLVETVLAAVMKRDQTLADLASQILTHSGTTSTTTGVGDGATIHGNVIITTTSEAGDRAEHPVIDLTLFSDEPLPQASPTAPVGLVLGLVNQSAQSQVAVIDGYGRGAQAIEFATRRITLQPYEATEVDLELKPDLTVTPGNYQVHLRARSETARNRLPATTALRFTVLSHQQVATRVSMGAEHPGAVSATLRNVGNAPLDLVVTASSDAEVLQAPGTRLQLPVGAEQTVLIGGLSRPLLRSRQVRLRLLLSSVEGYQSEQDHVLTLPAAFTWTPGWSLSRTPSAVRVVGALAVVLISLFTLFHGGERAVEEERTDAAPKSSVVPRSAAPPALDTPCPEMPTVDRAPARAEPSPGSAAGLQSVTMGGSVFGGVNLQADRHLALVASDDRRIHAFETRTMTEKWFSICLNGAGASQPTLAGDSVYAVSSAGSLYTFAVDATGEQAPVREPIPVGGRVTLKPYLSGDAIVVTVQKGDTSWVQTYSTTDGSSLGSRRYPGMMRQSPASARGRRLYWRPARRTSR